MDVEQIADLVPRIVQLLARTRAVELGILSKQFSALVSRDDLKSMQNDLQELEQATQASEDIYDQRARVKLIEFFHNDVDRILESYLMSNNCSAAIIRQLLANEWAERDGDYLRITESGRIQTRRWKGLREG